MIYLDYNATTPVADEVLAAMLPWFQERFGNPSSAHASGQVAADAVEIARRKVAGLLKCPPGRIVFTSGATEANNLAIKGSWAARTPGRDRILVTAAEHKSVLEAAWGLSPPAKVEILPVDETGMVDLHALDQLLGDDVAIVSVVAGNNEVGTLNPISDVAEIVRSRGAVFHTDASQWVGKLPIDTAAWNADLISLSAHKLYGPKGIGALYVGRPARLSPILDGGGQEGGLRGGTLNVAGIVGFGAACTLAEASYERISPMQDLRDELYDRLQAAIPDVSLNGHQARRLPNTLNVRFAGAEADAVLAGAPDVAASTGSACTSSVPSPSHVLLAMGLDSVAADESIRFSIGRSTTTYEVDRAVVLLRDSVARVRRLTLATFSHQESAR